jgi:hypothetical protein
MLKKVLLSVVIIILVFIGIIKTLDYFRVSNILTNIIGNVNYDYINKVDEEIFNGISGADETYIFYINDTSKVNCKLINEYPKSVKSLSRTSKKYFDILKPNCSKLVSDEKNRIISISIQNDILILNIFM